ncbi:MAG: hypothetical protein JSV39_01630 [Candidatus Aenigmatarchaeota archaeon]|nr:MAG: hypothetical protein JSV39_01630 [Candidatus Aenigmarchaeota archaeon]
MGYSSKIQLDCKNYLPEIKHDYLSLSKSKTVALQGTPDYDYKPNQNNDGISTGDILIIAAPLVGAGLVLFGLHKYREWRRGVKRRKPTTREKILKKVSEKKRKPYL